MGTSDLERAFSQFESIAFPPESDFEETSELHAELALYDTFMAGIITTLIKVGRVPREHARLLRPEPELRARLRVATESECSALAADAVRYLDYLDRLEHVVDLTARELRTSMDQ